MRFKMLHKVNNKKNLMNYLINIHHKTKTNKYHENQVLQLGIWNNYNVGPFPPFFTGKNCLIIEE